MIRREYLEKVVKKNGGKVYWIRDPGEILRD